MQLTELTIRGLFPDALDSYVSALAKLEPQLAKHGMLANPLHLAHFLAQCAAETGGFSVLRESGNCFAARLLGAAGSRDQRGQLLPAADLPAAGHLG